MDVRPTPAKICQVSALPGLFLIGPLRIRECMRAASHRAVHASGASPRPHRGAVPLLNPGLAPFVGKINADATRRHSRSEKREQNGRAGHNLTGRGETGKVGPTVPGLPTSASSQTSTHLSWRHLPETQPARSGAPSLQSSVGEDRRSDIR